jgi:hypothetical protein
MRSVCSVLLLFSFLLAIPVWGQQAQPDTPLPPAPQDPQAVNVVNQAIAAAGGAQALLTVTDAL